MTAVPVQTEPAALAASTLRRRRARRRFTARPLAVLGAVGVVVVVLVAILAPLISPADPSASNFDTVLAGPSVHHLAGTDQLGRDVLSRLFFGARSALLAGVLSTLLATVVAVPIGLVAGYYRRVVDAVVMRVMDVALAFPFLILAVGLAAILGPSLVNATLALGIAQVPVIVRITRGEVLAARELDYVAAARVNGSRPRAIMARQILPNVISPVVVQATVAIPASIIGAAILSFLGLGVQPPTADWGAMLSDAQIYLSQAPWLGVFPGVAIFLTALSFNLLGDGVRDALDPKMRP
ncbi:MAG TPA: ABC transporter permease [Mycobacteriales bacterium]|nr:ABC transporter permease [Mycobacteriales bacterium]